VPNKAIFTVGVMAGGLAALLQTRKCSARSDGDKATFAECRVDRQVIVGSAPGAEGRWVGTKLTDQIKSHLLPLAITRTMPRFEGKRHDFGRRWSIINAGALSDNPVFLELSGIRPGT